MLKRIALFAMGTLTTLTIVSMLNWQCVAKEAKTGKSGATKDAGKTDANASENSKVKAGKKLFEKLDCAECHSVGGTGGCLAPPLDGISERRSAKYISLRLGKNDETKFVELIGHPELLSHPRFPQAQVAQITAYLMTLPKRTADMEVPKHAAKGKIAEEKPEVKKDWAPMAATADSREGRRLFLESGCMSCHSIGYFGGFSAPRLDGIGSRHSRKYIEAHITNPQLHEAIKPNGKRISHMPQFEFQPNEVKQITDYLLTLPAQDVASSTTKPTVKTQ